MPISPTLVQKSYCCHWSKAHFCCFAFASGRSLRMSLPARLTMWLALCAFISGGWMHAYMEVHYSSSGHGPTCSWQVVYTCMFPISLLSCGYLQLRIWTGGHWSLWMWRTQLGRSRKRQERRSGEWVGGMEKMSVEGKWQVIKCMSTKGDDCIYIVVLHVCCFSYVGECSWS